MNREEATAYLKEKEKQGSIIEWELLNLFYDLDNTLSMSEAALDYSCIWRPIVYKIYWGLETMQKIDKLLEDFIKPTKKKKS